jgi:pSer/pThr/pTyr-binding forkhead associated (FHA) protein
MRIRLVPLEGGTPIEIAKDLVLVGRKEDCDLRLDHKSISKQHCVLAKTDGLLLLRDLGSTNGTRVNGQRVRRAALLPNDQLHIASLRFTVQVGPEEDPPSPDEFTQQIEGKELAKLLDKADRPGELDSDSSDVEIPVVRANALPDHYPEAAPSKK